MTKQNSDTSILDHGDNLRQGRTNLHPQVIFFFAAESLMWLPLIKHICSLSQTSCLRAGKWSKMCRPRCKRLSVVPTDPGRACATSVEARRTDQGNSALLSLAPGHVAVDSTCHRLVALQRQHYSAWRSPVVDTEDAAECHKPRRTRIAGCLAGEGHQSNETLLAGAALPSHPGTGQRNK